jgi:hypothetical protein
MRSPKSPGHTFLFRCVSTLVFSLVILSTVAADEPAPGSGIASVLTQVYTLFFGTAAVSPPADTTRPMARDTSCIWDPSCNPPPPSQ